MLSGLGGANTPEMWLGDIMNFGFVYPSEGEEIIIVCLEDPLSRIIYHLEFIKFRSPLKAMSAKSEGDEGGKEFRELHDKTDENSRKTREFA